MILKIFNLKKGNRDREETSDTSFMKKEHKQVTKDQKVWTQGHQLLVNIGICYPVHSTEIPILTSRILVTNCL